MNQFTQDSSPSLPSLHLSFQLDETIHSPSQVQSSAHINSWYSGSTQTPNSLVKNDNTNKARSSIHKDSNSSNF